MARRYDRRPHQLPMVMEPWPIGKAKGHGLGPGPLSTLHFLPCFQCAGFDSMHLPQLDSFTYGFCILLSHGLSSRTPSKAALQAANGRPSAGPFSSMYTENVAMSH